MFGNMLTTHLRYVVFAAVLALTILIIAPPAASMQKMAESELDEITAAGFSTFTLVDDSLATMRFNVRAETYAEIDSFWANNQAEGWDQDWQNVIMGSADEALRFEGFILEARFDDLSADNRQLLSLKMGFERVTGTLEADFLSLTRDGAGYPRRDAVGHGAYRFDGDPFIMNLDTDGAHGPGIYMDFGNAQPVSSP